MFQHVVLANEPLPAGVTGVRFLARVQAHVPPQVRLVIELFGALFALVGLLAGMLRDMVLVDHVAGEPFATPLTLERFIATVEGLVVLRQIAGFIEDFVAIEAFVDACLFRLYSGGDLGAAVFLVIVFGWCLFWRDGWFFLFNDYLGFNDFDVAVCE